jgi:hypothetical protein
MTLVGWNASVVRPIAAILAALRRLPGCVFAMEWAAMHEAIGDCPGDDACALKAEDPGHPQVLGIAAADADFDADVTEREHDRRQHQVPEPRRARPARRLRWRGGRLVRILMFDHIVIIGESAKQPAEVVVFAAIPASGDGLE